MVGRPCSDSAHVVGKGVKVRGCHDCTRKLRSNTMTSESATGQRQKFPPQKKQCILSENDLQNPRNIHKTSEVHDSDPLELDMHAMEHVASAWGYLEVYPHYWTYNEAI